MSEQQQYYPPPPAGEAPSGMTSRPDPQTTSHEQPPPPTGNAPASTTGSNEQYYPPPPPRSQDAQQPFPSPPSIQQQENVPAYSPQDYASGQPDQTADQQHLYPPPPKRNTNRYSGEQNITSPIHYTRDPKKLVAYLIPFPKPSIPGVQPDSIPQRFMIYTPPPPPFLDKPKEGEKEDRLHKVQRKWQDEVREAKTGNAKTMSWKGVKGKAVKGINWAAGQTKSSNLEFLNRIGGSQEQTERDTHADDGVNETDQTNATVKLEEMLLVYPSSMSGSPEELREEFINTMLRGKSKAQRDAVIATGLLPVSLAVDILITVIWPFGGLFEIDSVWAYASIRGAKTSRSVTKRLTSTGSQEDDKLHLEFTPSPRLAVLEKYLATRCHDRAADLFPTVGVSPSESEVLESIGWYPSAKGGAERNWEDEQWEISEVKDDLKQVMGKAAREWDKWCKAFEKDPQKAVQK